MFSELPVPASLSKGSYSEVLLALPLETYHRAGFWPSALLKKATTPAGKAQGGVFPLRSWQLSRGFSVCEVSSPSFLTLKNTVTLLLGHIWDVGCVCVWGGGVGVGGLEVGLLVGSPAVLSYHWLSGESDLMRSSGSTIR